MFFWHTPIFSMLPLVFLTLPSQLKLARPLKKTLQHASIQLLIFILVNFLKIIFKFTSRLLAEVPQPYLRCLAWLELAWKFGYDCWCILVKHLAFQTASFRNMISNVIYVLFHVGQKIVFGNRDLFSWHKHKRPLRQQSNSPAHLFAKLSRTSLKPRLMSTVSSPVCWSTASGLAVALISERTLVFSHDFDFDVMQLPSFLMWTRGAVMLLVMSFKVTTLTRSLGCKEIKFQ